jgi:hypothetical protein
MRRTTTRRDCGLTMLEVTIASVILVAVSAMAMYLMFTATNHVSNMEVRVRLDRTAREVMAQMCAELRQAKMSTVEVVNTQVGPLKYTATNLAQIPSLPGSGATKAPSQATTAAAYTSPYVTWDVAGTSAQQSAATFNGVRFRIPNHQMDLTKNNANADNGNPGDNFDLTKFKNAPMTGDWVAEIQYWWETDAPTSQGVIKRSETIFDSNQAFKVRHYTIVCRDVAALSFTVPKYPAWVTAAAAIPSTALAPAIPNQYPAGSEKQLTVSVQMLAPDPKYPTQTIQSVLSSAVDVRN